MSCAVTASTQPGLSPSPIPYLCRTFSPLSDSFAAVDTGERINSSSKFPKRKNHLKISIPDSTLKLDLPYRASQDPWEIEVEEMGYSVFCKKGRREFMEDRYTASVNLDGDKKQAIFGVFDGHGGATAAEFASENITKNIMEELEGRGDDDNDILEGIKSAYLSTDTEFVWKEMQGGACCVTALIRNGNLIVSNAGDCRAVLSRGGIAEALTVDHRPSRKDERDRIQKLGGYVDCYRGTWRLQGSLAVSRSIGDSYLKNWVTAEPDTHVERIEPDFEFLILASDGIWEKITNQEAVDITRSYFIGVEDNKSSLLSACKHLTEISIKRGSCDDITVMIVPLRNYI